MPVVQIENPFNKKVEQVEIAGEEPTEKELKDVFNFFKQESMPRGSKEKLDLTQASREEIQNYIRERRAAGLDPVTGEPLPEVGGMGEVPMDPDLEAQAQAVDAQYQKDTKTAEL